MSNVATRAAYASKNSPAPNPAPFSDSKRIAAIILGGGQGSRLHPLTLTRCKPAISFAGKYKLIDIAIANAKYSSCVKHIYVVTQFLSTSLHTHICNTYQGNQTFNEGFIDILSAEQRPSHSGWYQGTADAVRQNLYYLQEAPVDYFLILSGDQLYKMDFNRMVHFAQATDADLVIGTIPIEEEEAKRMGIMEIDSRSEVKRFVEKPQQRDMLDPLKICSAAKKRVQIEEHDRREYLGSMGIYLFKRQALIDLLEVDQREDFGKHLLPTKISQGGVYAYLHKGYWEDIGTIQSFYEANMALTRPFPSFDCYDELFPLPRTHSKLPGAKLLNTQAKHSIICEGSIVEADQLTHSILGPRTVIKKGCSISDSYIMGADFYTPPVRSNRFPEKLQISEDCVIRRAIIDKDVFIGKGVQLINKNHLEHYHGENIFIRDGIIIVPRGATVPDGFCL